MFENKDVFDPARDAKVPLKKTPLAFAVRFSLLTAELLFSRHPGDYLVWIKSMLARRKPLSYPIPWLTFDATRVIASHLDRRATVYEFGGGNSTLYWAQRASFVGVVEDNQDWLHFLDRVIKSKNINNVHLSYASDADAYTTAIKACKEKMFDVVIVDGSFRRECVKAAMSHVKPGGLLVVDNTDWHWFRTAPISGIPENWDRKAYVGYAPMMGYKSETTIYARPAAT